MTLEYLQWATLVFLTGGLVGTWWGLKKIGKENQKVLNEILVEYQAASDLIEAEEERKLAHTKAFETLSDPDKIVEEMEKSARATEMRIARRTTLPREDAGPPAKVYRPRILKHYPRSWPR